MDVQQAWDSIVGWCLDKAPATAAAIGQPCTPEAIANAESLFPRPWPDDLRAWYHLADGAERSPAGYLIPGFVPMPLAGVVTSTQFWASTRELMVAQARQRATHDVIAQRVGANAGMADYDVERFDAASAGEPAGLFLPSFVPVAEDRAGANLFVDLRPGRLHGCVTAYFKGDADGYGPLWPSVTAMLHEVAASLADGTPINHQYPKTADGRLEWTFDIPASGVS